MTADQEEEDPLLYAEQAREPVYRTPFPWFQLSILFMLQTARYLPTFGAVTFIPDVRSSFTVLKYCGPITLLSVNSKYWGSKGREGRGILCRGAGACCRPFNAFGLSE